MTDFIRVKHKNTDIYQLLSLRDVLYIQFVPDFSNVITEADDFLFPVTQQGLKDIVKSHHFTDCDKMVYVNVLKVMKIHSTLNYVVFDNVESIKQAKSEKKRMVFMDDRYTSKFKKLVGIENDLAYQREERSRGIGYTYKRNYADELL